MDLKTLLAQLRAVSDEELRRALRAERLTITADKYTTAFSCIAVAYDLRSFNFAVRTAPPDISDEMLQRNRQRASIIFLAFTALQYMRSDHLERGLDHVADGSPLRPFRDIFRAGSAKKGDDTFAQHIRNSLAHGTSGLPHYETPEILGFQGGSVTKIGRFSSSCAAKSPVFKASA